MATSGRRAHDAPIAHRLESTRDSIQDQGDIMIRTLINRRAATVLTAALTLGVAGPAVARPIDDNSPSWSYTAVNIPQSQPAADQAVASHSGGSSDLEYLLIGAGGTAVVMLSLGGAAAATHRRHTRATARPRVAA
jgi:hypothetical protein